MSRETYPATPAFGGFSLPQGPQQPLRSPKAPPPRPPPQQRGPPVAAVAPAAGPTNRAVVSLQQEADEPSDVSSTTSLEEGELSESEDGVPEDRTNEATNGGPPATAAAVVGGGGTPGTEPNRNLAAARWTREGPLDSPDPFLHQQQQQYGITQGPSQWNHASNQQLQQLPQSIAVLPGSGSVQRWNNAPEFPYQLQQQPQWVPSPSTAVLPQPAWNQRFLNHRDSTASNGPFSSPQNPPPQISALLPGPSPKDIAPPMSNHERRPAGNTGVAPPLRNRTHPPLSATAPAYSPMNRSNPPPPLVPPRSNPPPKDRLPDLRREAQDAVLLFAKLGISYEEVLKATGANSSILERVYRAAGILVPPFNKPAEVTNQNGKAKEENSGVNVEAQTIRKRLEKERRDKERREDEERAAELAAKRQRDLEEEEKKKRAVEVAKKQAAFALKAQQFNIKPSSSPSPGSSPTPGQQPLPAPPVAIPQAQAPPPPVQRPQVQQALLIQQLPAAPTPISSTPVAEAVARAPQPPIPGLTLGNGNLPLTEPKDRDVIMTDATGAPLPANGFLLDRPPIRRNKRPVAADFNDNVPSAKRKFGTVQRTQSLIIDVTDDESDNEDSNAKKAVVENKLAPAPAINSNPSIKRSSTAPINEVGQELREKEAEIARLTQILKNAQQKKKKKRVGNGPSSVPSPSRTPSNDPPRRNGMTNGVPERAATSTPVPENERRLERLLVEVQEARLVKQKASSAPKLSPGPMEGQPQKSVSPAAAAPAPSKAVPVDTAPKEVTEQATLKTDDDPALQQIMDEIAAMEREEQERLKRKVILRRKMDELARLRGSSENKEVEKTPEKKVEEAIKLPEKKEEEVEKTSEKEAEGIHVPKEKTPEPKEVEKTQIPETVADKPLMASPKEAVPAEGDVSMADSADQGEIAEESTDAMEIDSRSVSPPSDQATSSLAVSSNKAVSHPPTNDASPPQSTITGTASSPPSDAAPEKPISSSKSSSSEDSSEEPSDEDVVMSETEKEKPVKEEILSMPSTPVVAECDSDIEILEGPPPKLAAKSTSVKPTPKPPTRTLPPKPATSTPAPPRPSPSAVRTVPVSSQPPPYTQTAPVIAQAEPTPPKPTGPKNHYSPYVSPLQKFKSFRFHKHFNEMVTGGITSLTYSNKIDPRKFVCKYECAGGTCNDDSCKDQHWRDMRIGEDEILVQMAMPEGQTEEKRQAYLDGLRETIVGMKKKNIQNSEAVARAIADWRRDFWKDETRVLRLEGS